MNDPFTTRVRAAAAAGWWTVLIAVGFSVLLWGAYLITMSNRPAWLPRMWGPDVSWAEIQQLFLRMILALRFFLWVLLLGVIWLTLWGRQLKKRAAA